MENYDLTLKHIIDESRNATADSLGGTYASMADAREMQIGGMIELAQLLSLPHAFIDVLDDHRWTLINAANAARKR